MLGLSATYNYYLFNGNVDMRKGIFRLREVVQNTMGQNPDDSHNVFIFMSKSRKIVKLLHFERASASPRPSASPYTPAPAWRRTMRRRPPDL